MVVVVGLGARADSILNGDLRHGQQIKDRTVEIPFLDGTWLE